ncbi:MAG: hypothetical protein Ct9H300mP23_11130 [Nitrospinota bacterium]|nr:MAG: hypothetical protein Ct9H300mP23_11130 [Nitrospinota bacterium]
MSSSYPSDEFEYQLLDTGSFQKLEQFGPHRFCRPAPQALWPKSLPAPNGKKQKENINTLKAKIPAAKGKLHSPLPKNGWRIKFRDIVFKVQPTGFGHIGIFPEQAPNWLWIIDQLKLLNGKEIKILNVFGYTGGSTWPLPRQVPMSPI